MAGKQSLYDWNHVDVMWWMRWLAAQPDGKVWGYLIKPTCNVGTGEWEAGWGVWKAYCCTLKPNCQTVGKDSLEERPK